MAYANLPPTKSDLTISTVRLSSTFVNFRLPTGLVYDPTGQVIVDPDEQVQAAIQLVFDLFDELGSARAVVKHFAGHQLLFPTRSWGDVRDGELVWKSTIYLRGVATYQGARQLLQRSLFDALVRNSGPRCTAAKGEKRAGAIGQRHEGRIERNSA
jgi:hypothetical protein